MSSLPFDWQFPYPSQRMPVMARNCVASSQPLAAQAGLRMLLKGGNAVDAALATAITLTVVEPVANGIGSDAFAIVWDGKKLHGLNASGRSPAAWTPQRFAGMKEMPRLGPDSVTVPGAVSGWRALSERFGKLPFGDLFEPAIKYAREGFRVSPTIARLWAAPVEALRPHAGFAEAFLPNGRAPTAGERFSFPDQACTLERIAETRTEAFYTGDLAEKTSAHLCAHGGAMTVADLAAHRCDWVDPLHMDYRGYRLHELPPNGQGIGALMSLGMLGNLDMRQYAVDSPDFLHVQIEAMKLVFADLYQYVGDSSGMRVQPRDLLDPAYLASRVKLIDMQRAADPKHGLPQNSGTVYLTAADESGMMVSYIQSNFTGFGSGVVVPGTGISLHGRGFGFVTTEGHANQVGPNKRPYHTIIPAFVTKDGQPLISFGLMASSMQPQGHSQIMVRYADVGQNPQAAIDAPRWRVDLGLKVNIEQGFKPEVYEELKRRGHQLALAPRTSTDFGRAQFIHRLEGGEYLAASEWRTDGQAVGY